ncbi:hypothetical protein EVAR_66775_1 [Eumeta japonica]|uniref:Uncharacterized protein n=1 Tax=Eumeta variegata TaxID=151549 RepID=A0A4C1ZWX9_EUMVA|nr:hypothetical protein EVAR_66775_1 [Eumeta japonica]
MSHRLTENQISQIKHDFCDFESEGIGDTPQENILEEVGDISDRESIHSEHNSASEIEESDDTSTTESTEDTTSNSLYGKTDLNEAKLHHIHLVFDSTTSSKSEQPHGAARLENWRPTEAPP